MNPNKKNNSRFFKAYTAVADIFKNIVRTFRLIWESDKRLMTINLVLVIFGRLEAVLDVYLFKLVVDNVVGTVSNKIELPTAIHNISLYILIELAGGIVVSIIDNYSQIVDGLLSDKLLNNVNYRLVGIINRLKLRFFEDPGFYDKYEKVRRNSVSRPVQLYYTFIILLGEFFTAVSFMVILASFHPPLVVLIVIGVIPLFVFDSFFAKKMYCVTDARVPQSRLVNYLSSMLFSEHNTREIRVFGLHKYFYKLYKDTAEKFYSENVGIFSKQAFRRIPWLILSQVSYFICLVFLAFKALYGLISLGSFTFYNSALGRSRSAVRSIFRQFSFLYENNLYLNDLFDFFDLPESSFEKTGGIKVRTNKMVIKVEDLSFRYPGSKRLVLNKLNMVIRPGESVALVGKNGAGKTTLVKLLCGFYAPTSGRILINGKPLETLDLENYRRKIGVVFQDFVHYQFPVTDNIGFGKLESIKKLKKITEAAKKAGAHGFIEKLPKKYHQQIGKQFEEGMNLSTGQLQKLALARAFMADAPFMIMDEPTASSDAEAEFKLFEQIEKFSEQTSLLLISHRFSTVRIANKIYVIEKGKVIEQGSHDQLLKKGGLYAKLFKIQARGYKV